MLFKRVFFWCDEVRVKHTSRVFLIAHVFFVCEPVFIYSDAVQLVIIVAPLPVPKAVGVG